LIIPLAVSIRGPAVDGRDRAVEQQVAILLDGFNARQCAGPAEAQPNARVSRQSVTDRRRSS
jgi:hypothetical protein